MKNYGLYSIIVLIYALVVLAGGLIGYIKAASSPSLFMGSLFGLSLILCAWAVHNEQYAGVVLSMILTALLTIFFGYRYGMTKIFMPSGLMAILSSCVFFVLSIINYQNIK